MATLSYRSYIFATDLCIANYYLLLLYVANYCCCVIKLVGSVIKQECIEPLVCCLGSGILSTECLLHENVAQTKRIYVQVHSLNPPNPYINYAQLGLCSHSLRSNNEHHQMEKNFQDEG